MTMLTSAAWEALHERNRELGDLSISDLFAHEGDRLERMTASVGPLFVDFSKHRIAKAGLAALYDLAAACDLPRAVQALFDGEPLNVTEGRAALHTALRGAESNAEAACEARRDAQEAHEAMRALLGRVHSGEWRGVRGQPVERVVSIGIGGSDLGPRLACEALSFQDARLPVHFAPNVDGHALARILRDADPDTTLFCVISKSFTTRETLLNATTARRWLADALGVDEQAAGAQFVAVTSRPDRAEAFGIAADRVLPMFDWVGGRYSLWSTVGLPVALGLGMDVFEALLDGAAEMDRHFRTAPLQANVPIHLALIGIWNRNVLGMPAYTCVPYDDRLGLLGEYLQQLDMESNGKRVRRDGAEVAGVTGPACWGGVGTNSQHAYFQWLHQGTDPTPVDFIGVREADHPYADHHRELLANLVGQSWALMRGRDEEETARALELSDPGLVRQGVFPGSRPSTTVVLDRLSPRALGALLALYEHKIFCQGWIWGINSFDQWGVELGKTLARRVDPWLSGAEVDADVDPSTRGLIGRLRN